MLPDINLDNEGFDEIYDNARNLIVSTYPEWTDFNYHDPGATMLEMLALLKESQQYYINKIGPENVKKYLKLLGLEKRTKVPSQADVSITYENDIAVEKGTKLYAGDICFEADRRTYVSASSVDVCVCDYGEKKNVITRDQFYFGANLRIRPFAKPDKGKFYIGFDKPLEKDEIHGIRFDITSADRIERNPITDPESFIPLVDMSVEYFDGSKWKKVHSHDGTFGFLFSGTFSFSLKNEHKSCSVAGHKAYYIRFVIKGGEYDALPVIRNIYFHLLHVTQRDTKAEYADFKPTNKVRLSTELSATGDIKIFLKTEDGMFTPYKSFSKRVDEKTGEVICSIPGGKDSEGVRVVSTHPDFAIDKAVGFGTGLPFQMYDLDTDELEYETFAIMTELPDSGGKYVEWKKVRDFAAAKTDDFVYTLDSEKGIIAFGDCINGMAPEGEILIIGYSRTRGADGYVTRGKIKDINGFSRDEIKVENPHASTGGRNEETEDDCFIRAQKLMQNSYTVVTNEDAEKFITATQGLRIEKCKVIESRKNEPNCTAVVVKPYSANGMGAPSERYISNILASIEPHRMLGTQFRIVRPEYAKVSIYADVTVSRNYSSPKDAIKKVITDFFSAIKDEFGAQIIYSKLYETIDSLDCVLSVNVLTMQAEGSESERTREGDLVLSRNVAAYLDDVEIMTNI